MRTTAMALVLLAAAAVAGEENLLGNGGFEGGREGWLWVANSRRAELTFDRKVKAEGKQSALIAKEGGFPVDALFANFPVAEEHRGGRLRVSAKVRGEELGNAWVKFMLYPEAGENLLDEANVNPAVLRGTFDWQTVERTFDVPESAASGRVLVQHFVEGKLWIDEVRVEPLPAAAFEEAPRKPLDQSTKRWLDRNAVAVASIDIDGPLDDLDPLKKILKGVRVVQLGEQTHGDGAAFAAKCRLIRFLHEEMGFNVLAFESGLYECDRANALLGPELDPKAAMRASIFRIWHTARTLPIFAFMAKRAGTDRPLRLAGFDPQESGELAKEFVPEVLELLRSCGVSVGDPEASVLRVAFDDNRAAIEKSLGKQEAEFLSRCIDDLGVREALAAEREGDGDTRLNLRDERMARNLIWLAETRYPREKIVCWAATAHQARNRGLIRWNGRPDPEGLKMMGEFVHEHFGKECYTIGFASYAGRAGRWFSPKFEIAKPREGSLEDLFHRYGEAHLFVDLRRRNPFDDPMLLTPMTWTRDIVAPWPKVIDGVFYIERMVPARFMGD